jgi:hypothetical protein
MPHGFFTVEQWTSAQEKAVPQWVPILHLDSYQSLSKTVDAMKKRGEPGLFRIADAALYLAEMEEGELRLRGSHAS